MKFKDHLRQDDHTASTAFDPEREKCVCQDCNKTFFKGDEGDNEKFCLRCEAIATLSREEEDYE